MPASFSCIFKIMFKLLLDKVFLPVGTIPI